MSRSVKLPLKDLLPNTSRFAPVELACNKFGSILHVLTLRSCRLGRVENVAKFPTLYSPRLDLS